MSFDFSPFSAVLFDLDGTLYKEDDALPGAVELVHRLRGAGTTVACVSNSTQSPQRVIRRLNGMGIDLAADVIFTASASAVHYVIETYRPRPRVYNLATEGIAEMLEGKVTWTQDEQEPCDAVIIANPQGYYATVPRMRSALRLICQGAACIGICGDRLYPSPHGLEIGSGAMTAMFAYAANVEPILFGKPQKRFFEQLCRRLGVEPAKCILIGDNLESDIGGAKAMGMKTILTLAGVAKRSDLEHATAQARPDWVVEGLEELI